jgi:hypothetical protein
MISFHTCPKCLKPITGEIQICPRCGWQLDGLTEEDSAEAQLTTSLTTPTSSAERSTMAEEHSAEAQPATPSADDEASLIRKAREQGKWIFGLLWIIANTFGWGICPLLALASGWIVWQLYQNFSARSVFNPLGGESNRAFIAMIIVGVCWGAIIGGFQLSILARRFELKGKNWVFATIVGMTLYMTVQLFRGFTHSFSQTDIFVNLTFSFVPPLVLGLAQWFILRRYFTRSGWWIVAITLALGLAASITSGLSRLLVMKSSMGYRYDIFFSSSTFFIEGLFYGVATWIVLTIISRRPVATRVNMPYEREGFNWMLLLFGAIGFWVGFAFTNAISVTIHNIAQNAFADVFPNTGVGPEVGILRGTIVGGIGGAALGLAFKDKIHAIYFSLTGAIGFAIAFALVISLDPSSVPDLGRTIIRLMGGPRYLSSFETSLAHGLGAGAIVGAIGGLILGLASTKGRIVSCLLLCFTGVIWFGNAFAFASTLPSGDPSFSWDGWAGAVGGAIFGLTLALYYKIHDKLKSINFPRAMMGQEQR